MWKKDRNVLLFIILLLLAVLLFAWVTGRFRISAFLADNPFSGQIQIKTVSSQTPQTAKKAEQGAVPAEAARKTSQDVAPAEVAKKAEQGAAPAEAAKKADQGAVPAEAVKKTLQGASLAETKEETARESGGRGKVALTFDDGPHPKYTLQLLEGLAKRNVKASFFITGENARLYPELVKKMYEEGHLVGNHTYSHLQLNKSNREAFKEELIKTNEIIKEITGEEVVFVRPPYGSWDKSFEEELNMFPVLWTIDPLDWCSDDAACVINKVVPKVKENAIILMHDEYASTVTAALQIVDELQKQGYELVTVDEILFD